MIEFEWIKDHVKYYGCPVLSDIHNKDYAPTQYSKMIGRERCEVLGY